MPIIPKPFGRGPLFGGKSVSPPNWQFNSQLVWHMIAVGPPIVAIVRYGRT
jgi:hypothetical protein